MLMLKFELPEQMVLAMVNVLRTGPYNIVAPILAELQKQANNQTIASPPASPISNGKELPHE